MQKLDAGDIKILRIIQEDCSLTAREISDQTTLPIRTVFAKIERIERLGLVKGYHAVLRAEKLGAGTTAFILASFAHKGEDSAGSQRKVAKEISDIPDVQEVHIIAGEWDILIKLKARDVESVGKYVVEKLRLIKGIEKTLTCFVFESVKESAIIPLR
jgi:DNA-binding Lrp family transcriptional regulator